MLLRRGRRCLHVLVSTLLFACFIGLCSDNGIILHHARSLLGLEDVQLPELSVNGSAAISQFPKAIYQTAPHIGPDTPKTLTESWKRMNPHYYYEIFDDESALRFVSELYNKSRPDLVRVFRDVHQKVITADLFRYILMFELGGIYTDVDTECLRSIDTWGVPHNATINLVVGLETNELDPGIFGDDMVADFGFVHRLQFLQWTLMAKPRHSVMETAINQIVDGIIHKARSQQKAIKSVRFTHAEILNLSGPGLYTRIVKAYIQDETQRRVLDAEMASTSYEHVLADVMILPVNAWAPAQRHSQAGTTETALVYHGFAGSWKTPWWKDLLPWNRH